MSGWGGDENKSNKICFFAHLIAYNGGTVLLLYAVLTLTFPRDEGYTFDSFIGMDCPPPNWNEGLDPELTKDLHLISQFHNLFQHELTGTGPVSCKLVTVNPIHDKMSGIDFFSKDFVKNMLD